MKGIDLRKDERFQRLLKQAKTLGYFVRFSSVNKWFNGEWSPGKPIMVYTCRDGKSKNIADIAFILAHEIRHAEHYSKGLYPESYAEYFYADEIHKTRIVAYLAELDCDRYARAFIEKNFPGEESVLRDRLYPVRGLDDVLLTDEEIKEKKEYIKCLKKNT